MKMKLAILGSLVAGAAAFVAPQKASVSIEHPDPNIQSPKTLLENMSIHTLFLIVELITDQDFEYCTQHGTKIQIQA